MNETCPRTVDLSALLDQQLAPGERCTVEAHAAACPVCARHLADLRALRADLRALPSGTLGFDLAGVIEGRLAQRPARAKPRVGGRPRLAWLSLGAGMVASVSLGVALGAMLMAGSGTALAPRMAAMAVFDPIAPGGLCIGLDACNPSGTVK